MPTTSCAGSTTTSWASDSLVPIESLHTRVRGLARAHRQADRRLRRRSDRRRLHLPTDPRIPARRGRALRRAARRAVLDDRPPARGLHADQQRRRHAQPALRDRRDRPGHPPGQARHDGRVRHAEHRHRGGLAGRQPQRAARDRMLYPKRPGSFYHLSKVHDSHNIEFACRIWGLRATDLNQGVVYGQQTEETVRDDRLATRFDYDAVFGTVLNRFVDPGRARPAADRVRRRRADPRHSSTSATPSSASGSPARTRPTRGEFRVFNQMTEQLSVLDIAKLVADLHPNGVEVEHLDNPRVEPECTTTRSRTPAWSLGPAAAPALRHAAHLAVRRSPSGTSTASTSTCCARACSGARRATAWPYDHPFSVRLRRTTRRGPGKL